jgi:hypothetical protein
MKQMSEEGEEVMVLLAGDHDHMGCFTDQVKLTRAMIQDLDEVVKEIKLLGQQDRRSHNSKPCARS